MHSASDTSRPPTERYVHEPASVQASVPTTAATAKQGDAMDDRDLSQTFSGWPDTSEQIGLLQAAMAEIGAAQDTRSALSAVLRRLCTEMGWVLGQAWIVNQDETELERVAAWVREPDKKLDEFLRISGEFRFGLAKGFLGRVWSSKRPVWVPDIQQDHDFLRSVAARAAGLISALGVPIITDNEVIAVLELLCCEPRHINEQLSDSVQIVAGQLGWAIRHKRAHDALRDRTELLKCHNKVLEDIARGEPLRKSLDSLIRVIESQCNGMYGSILLIDPDGVHVRHGAAPSLPESFVRCVDGKEIGPNAGSCGTAAFRREPVIVEDIATDPLWENYRELALQHDLRACWSTPIFDGQQRVLGTFALYFKHPCSPTPRHRELIEMATSTAAIAIVRYRESEALRESEQRLRLAMSIGNIGIWQWNVSTDRLMLGEELQNAFQWLPSLEDLTAKRFVETIHPEDRPRVLTSLERSLAEHTDADIEFRYIRPSGSVRWIVVKGRAEYNSAAQPKRMVGIGLDITDRMRAEEQIRKSKTELQEVLDNSPGLIYMKNEAGRYTFVNRRWTELFRPVFGDALGKTDFEYFPEAQARQYVANDREVIESGQAGEFEEQSVLPDGVHSSQSIKVALKDQTGKFYALCGISTDITERKAKEEALRQTHRALRVLSQCNSAVVHATEEQSLLEEVCRVAVGPAGYRLAWVGYADSDEAHTVRPVASAGPAEGFLDRIHVSWGDNEYGRGSIGPAIRTGKPTVVRRVRDHSTFRVWHDAMAARNLESVCSVPLREGDRVWGALAVYAAEPDAFERSEVELIVELGENLAHGMASLRARKERAAAMHALMRARTELEERVRQRTAELVQAKDAAESADRLKSAFLATMSHELRTPLNSIIGFTGIVIQGLAGPLNEEQKKQLGMVQNSSRHLLALINDVLDISKIEAGQLEIECAPFSVSEAIRKALSVVSPLADKKGIALRMELATDVDNLLGDQRRTEQILINLLGNAVKFTDKGQVHVRCERDHEWLVARVHDTGVGIDIKDQQTIFEPFRQADTGLARKHEGTGLGLSICKRLLDRLGGSIAVESTPGQGSTFTVRLPLQAEVCRENNNTGDRR
jgi:PAS domain S-box-containing protein